MFKNILPALRVGYSNVFLATEPLLTQSTRNTFILKRRWQPKQHRLNHKPHKLRSKHYVYDLVEDTSQQKKAPLEVILTAFVEGIGDKGDVVALKQNLAYNKLLLPGLAVYKTPENLQKYIKTETEKIKVTHSSPHAQRTVNMLELRTLAVIMNKDVPWVIEPWHIVASFRKMGVNAVEEAIELPKEPITGPDLTKQNKEFYVTVTVNNLEKARVKCRIHHWSTDPSERLPYVFEHWKEPSEPIFGNEIAGSTVEAK